MLNAPIPMHDERLSPIARRPSWDGNKPVLNLANSTVKGGIPRETGGFSKNRITGGFMFHQPLTIGEAKEYRYGKWAGDPSGQAYDQTCCAAEIHDGFRFYQCSRKNGKGPDGLYCGIHVKKLKSGQTADSQ